MDTLRRDYEKVLLGIAVAALIAVAVVIAVLLLRLISDSWVPEPHRGQAVAPLDATTLSNLEARASNPQQWEGRTLFGPPKGPNPSIDPEFCKWLTVYKLPCDRGVEKKDPDGDGWTNEEEWKLGSVPIDSRSLPAMGKVLAYVRFIRQPFPLQFKGYTTDPNGTHSLQFNDVQGRTFFVRKGDMVGDTPYRLESYRIGAGEDFDPKVGGIVRKEMSRATLRNIREAADTELPLNGVAHSRTLKGELWNAVDGDSRAFSVGDKFKVRGQEFRVIEVTEDGMVISDDQGKRTTLPLKK